MKRPLLLFPLALLLAACTQSPGWIITAKETHPAWTQISSVPGCLPVSAPSCVVLTYHPEAFELQITLGTETRTVPVNGCTYSNSNIGDYFQAFLCGD